MGGDLARVMRRAALAGGGLLAMLAGTAPCQQVVRGTVFDSLLRVPLSGADLWVRGTNWRARTDSVGLFAFDSVVPGDYTVLLSHRGLDSAGLYTLPLPLTVRAGDTALVRLAIPALGTLWARRCGQELTPRADSGLVFGVVQDAATGARLEGAGVLLRWLRITQTDPINVTTQERNLTARTDSTGTYYACGVSRDMKIALRGYAAHDSTGMLDLQLGRRGVGRQDLMIALGPARQRAVLRGNAQTDERTPLYSGRVSVREGPSTVVEASGGYTVTGVAPGTQWVTVQAIGRAPVGRAVDFRAGDTTWLDVALGPLPVSLSPIRVVGQPSRMLQEFEERRRAGLGYSLGEAEIKGAGSLRGVVGALPTVRIGRGSGIKDFVVMLPRPGVDARGYCVATLYVDGFLSDYDQLQNYRPEDLVGIEMYPRASLAPIQFQSISTGCGVLIIWTKYLK
jgi:hypothetical protein